MVNPTSPPSVTPRMPNTRSTSVDTASSYDSDNEPPHLSEKDISEFTEFTDYKMFSGSDLDNTISTASTKIAPGQDQNDLEENCNYKKLDDFDPNLPSDEELLADEAFDRYNRKHLILNSSIPGQTHLIDEVPIYRYDKERFQPYPKIYIYILGFLLFCLVLFHMQLFVPLGSPIAQAINVFVHTVYTIFAFMVGICNHTIHPYRQSFWFFASNGIKFHSFLFFMSAVGLSIDGSGFMYHGIITANAFAFFLCYRPIITAKKRINAALDKYTYGCLVKLEDSLEIRFPEERSPFFWEPAVYVWFFDTYDLLDPILERGGTMAAYDIVKMQAIRRAITNIPIEKHPFETYISFPPMTLLDVYDYINELRLYREYIDEAEFERREEVFTAELEAKGLANQIIELK